MHLLVLVHGMWGNPSNLKQLELLASQKPEFHVMVAKTNSEESTYDGIDWGGERVAQEILDEVLSLSKGGKTVTRFSITGYSLGGLVSRYVVGILEKKQFFQNVTPVNFSAIATPHLGLPRYPSVMSYLGNFVGPRLLSRTGEQFYCADKWSNTGRPLLEVMADPQKVFYQALANFQEIRIFANAVYDLTVPYVTAAIEVDDPFIDHTTNGIQITLRDDYPRIIKSYTLPTSPSPKSKSIKSKRPSVPPIFIFRFPFNLLFYVSLPFVVPVVITFVFMRFMKESKKSRARIKLLEEEKSGESLAKILEEVVKETVENLIHHDDSTETRSSSTPPVANDVDIDSSASASTSVSTSSSNTLPPVTKRKSVLSPLQKRIASQLNTLPIKKELAFFDEVYNAHATIVMRDPKRFPIQKIGEGMVRMWGDSLRT